LESKGNCCLEQPVTVARSRVVFPGESDSADDNSTTAKDEVAKFVKIGGQDKTYFVGSMILPRNRMVPLPFSRIRKMNG
jgi:hypothetical protein